MNYTRIYNELISNRRDRPPSGDEQSHVHHIIPRCDGGSDHPSNLVRLTVADHQFAHYLLAKARGTQGNWAAVMIIFGSSRVPTKKQRRLAAKAAGAGYKHSEESKAKISATAKGRQVSPEAKAKLSAAMSGSKHHFFGKKLSDEHRSKMSASQIGKKLSAEHREKLSAAAKIRYSDPATRARQSGANSPCFGKKVPSETLAKRSATLKGRKLSPEHRAKIAARAIGRKHTDETKAKMSLSRRGKGSTAFPLMVQAQKNEAQLNAILDWEAAQDKLEHRP